MKKYIIGVVVVIVVVFLGGSVTQIDAGQVGVVLNFGAFKGEVFQPGLNFKNPFTQSVVKVGVQTQKLQIEKSEAYTKDLQNVDINSVINYEIDAKTVGDLYQRIGMGYEGKILIPALESTVKSVIAQYTAEEVLNKRGEVQSKISELYKQNIPSYFLGVKYSLIDEAFSPEYEKAIERKQVAQQDAERAQNELKKAQIDAEQRVVTAKAEAEAIRVQSEAASNEKYVSLKALEVQEKAIEKWNGVLPMQFIPGSSMPFINVSH